MRSIVMLHILCLSAVEIQTIESSSYLQKLRGLLCGIEDLRRSARSGLSVSNAFAAVAAKLEPPHEIEHERALGTLPHT